MQLYQPLKHCIYVFYGIRFLDCKGAAAELSESEENTLTSKTDLSMLSDEGLELSHRQTDTIFQGPSLDDQAEELIIGRTPMTSMTSVCIGGIYLKDGHTSFVGLGLNY